MKILIVHYNPAEPGQAGGAESAIRDQKRALELCGHEVKTAFQRPDRACRDFQPDIVHFHTIHVSIGLGVLRWAQGQEIPHCLSLHDYWPFCGGRMLLKSGDQSCAAVKGICDSLCESKPALPAVKDLVNRSPVVTFNPNSAAIYRRHGIRVDAVIPHSIDTDFFCPGESTEEPRIVTTCAWPSWPTKGMHILKAALRKIGAKAKLVTGVSRERVRDELQKANIFVFPSCYEETWGLCLSEALSCGLACISSNVAGPKAQITHGENGLLFENRNVDELATHLMRMIENKEERDQLGRNARAWAKAVLPLERMGHDYERFYRRIIDDSLDE